MSHFGLERKILGTKIFFGQSTFFTGHTFGRFPGNIPNYVRLVRDR